MVKSIKQGVFFDQKYWVRHPKDGRVLKSIYFSSLIAGNSLRKCTSTYRVDKNDDVRTRREGIINSNGQDTVITRPTREIDAESDCESDFVGVGDSTWALPPGYEEAGRVRATLSPGSFSA